MYFIVSVLTLFSCSMDTDGLGRRRTKKTATQITVNEKPMFKCALIECEFLLERVAFYTD